MHANTWKMEHIWHRLHARTTATVPMERDQTHQETSHVNVYLGIVDNSVKKVWFNTSVYSLFIIYFS